MPLSADFSNPAEALSLGCVLTAFLPPLKVTGADRREAIWRIARAGQKMSAPEALDAMRLALYQPDIAQNTGTILRLAACLDVPVDVIGPTGFDMTDRALRRAALDYLDSVRLTRHESFAAFMAARRAAEGGAGRLILFSARAETAHTEFAFEAGDTLLFGRESAGCPESVHSAADARVRIPISAHLRSLNVAVTAAIGLAEALRQTGAFPQS